MAVVPVVIPLHGDYKDKYAPVEKALEGMRAHVIGVIDEKSEGFTPTVNRGIKVARHLISIGYAASEPGEEPRAVLPYVWILNQDAIPHENALEALLEFMDEHPQCGIAASMQVHPDDGDIITYGGSGPVDPGIHYTGYVSEGQHLEPKMMGWANGAAMFVRAAVFDEIGVLDKRMTMICSDSDFSFRARQAGWEVWYAPTSVVTHQLNFSANPPGDRLLEFGDNRRVFHEKWMGGDWKELNLEVFD